MTWIERENNVTDNARLVGHSQLTTAPPLQIAIDFFLNFQSRTNEENQAKSSNNLPAILLYVDVIGEHHLGVFGAVHNLITDTLARHTTVVILHKL